MQPDARGSPSDTYTGGTLTLRLAGAAASAAITPTARQAIATAAVSAREGTMKTRRRLYTEQSRLLTIGLMRGLVRLSRRSPRLSMRRALVGLVACGWLAVGLAGASHYVHAYAVYRGFPVPRTPAGIPQGKIKTISFDSPAVGRSRYMVYLPPGYARAAARGKRFPVLYLLHGSPGKMPVFINVAAAHVAENVLIA